MCSLPHVDSCELICHLTVRRRRHFRAKFFARGFHTNLNLHYYRHRASTKKRTSSQKCSTRKICLRARNRIILRTCLSCQRAERGLWAALSTMLSTGFDTSSRASCRWAKRVVGTMGGRGRRVKEEQEDEITRWMGVKAEKRKDEDRTC